jgi:hypothetical protein
MFHVLLKGDKHKLKYDKLLISLVLPGLIHYTQITYSFIIFDIVNLLCFLKKYNNYDNIKYFRNKK